MKSTRLFFRGSLVLIGSGALCVIVVARALTGGQASRASQAATAEAEGQQAAPERLWTEVTTPVNLPRAAPGPVDPASSSATTDREPSTAAQERKQILDEVQSSGTCNEPWTGTASQLFRDLESVLSPARASRHTYVECFQRGCTQTVTYKSSVESEDALTKLKNTRSWFMWKGNKARSAPEELPNGEVVNSYVLYRPEGA